MSSLHRIIVLVLCQALARLGVAQSDPLVDALRWFQADELQKARTAVDEAVTDPRSAADPEAWLLRGFVYKELFKESSGLNRLEALRDTALHSLEVCIGLDREGTYRENAVQAYEYMTRTYFNDAARALNDGDAIKGLEMYGRYRTSALRLDPATDLRTRDVEFYNALGSTHNQQYAKDRTRTDLFEQAVDAFSASLAIDPDNHGANYNLATLYYNRAVHAIRAVNASDDLPSLQRIQKVSREYFQKALPFMLRAHELDPARPEVLLGLENIYYSLGDDQRTDEYRRRYEAIVPISPER